MTLLERGPGGVVGEFALLAPAPRSASATAVEPSLLLRLGRGPFEELLDDHPEIARAVISTFAVVFLLGTWGVLVRRTRRSVR